MKEKEIAVHKKIEEKIIDKATSDKVGDPAPEVEIKTSIKPTSWGMYSTSQSSWDAMMEDMKKAKKSIWFLQYLLDDVEEGKIGWEFLNVCKDKNKEGVEVIIILDPVGSHTILNSSILEELKEAGIKILYNGFRTSFTSSRFPHIHVDHRKLLIVDAEISYVGGVVWAEMMKGWSDVMVRYEGAITKSLCKVFENVIDCVENDADMCVINHEGEDEWFIVQQRPGFSNRDISDSIIEHIRKATNHLRIVTPYFAPPGIMLKEIYRARARGVQVEIILPRKIDHKIMSYVNRSYLKKLLSQGVAIYLFNEFSLHAKFLSVDNIWSSVGSCNMDTLSHWMNYELNIQSVDSRFCKDVDSIFGEYKSKSTLIDNNYFCSLSLIEKILIPCSKIARFIV